MSNIKIGTIVKEIIETTLPQSLIDKIKANGCGCEKREEWLNNLTK
jgi:hypothetical protein